MSRRFVHLVVPLLLVLAACGKDDGADTQTASATGSATGSVTSSSECEIANGVDTAKTGELHVALGEYTIAYDEPNAEAGIVQVEATNDGDEDHELVIVKGAEKDLPVTDGVVDEDKVDLVGEIEPFSSGNECVAKFELAPGTYTLFCGIVEEDEGLSHFQAGMVKELEVK